jgi:hypothetical protein
MEFSCVISAPKMRSARQTKLPTQHQEFISSRWRRTAWLLPEAMSSANASRSSSVQICSNERGFMNRGEPLEDGMRCCDGKES